MGLPATNAVWSDPEITDPYELLVLLALGDYANELMSSWPSIATLAKKTRMTARGVQKVLARLRERNKLAIRFGGGPPKSTNTFTIMPRQRELPLNTVQGSEVSTPEHGSPHPRTGFRGPLNGVHPPPERGSGDPSGD